MATRNREVICLSSDDITPSSPSGLNQQGAGNVRQSGEQTSRNRKGKEVCRNRYEGRCVTRYMEAKLVVLRSASPEQHFFQDLDFSVHNSTDEAPLSLWRKEITDSTRIGGEDSSWAGHSQNVRI